jgi:hypothetical protein
VQDAAVSGGRRQWSAPFSHGTNAASVEVNAVVDILHVGKRQIVMQPVWRVDLRKFDLAGFDTIDDAHMQAIIAHDFHVFFDLVGRSHGGVLAPAIEKKRRCTSLVPEFQRSTASPPFSYLQVGVDLTVST